MAGWANTGKTGVLFDGLQTIIVRMIKPRFLTTVLGSLLLIGGVAIAQRPKENVSGARHPNLAAAQRLTDAAHLLATEPTSIQLRYLQTLTEIGVEKNTTIIFPVPVDLLTGLQQLVKAGTAKAEAPVIPPGQ